LFAQARENKNCNFCELERNDIMQIIENNKVKEKLYIKKFENGLTVMVIPKKGITKKFAIIGTNYGSIDNKFIIPGQSEETDVPDGVAHYLEHKMFEQKDGTNSLDKLTALGANANAYTTNDHTAYLFDTTENFYESLDELMDYIQNPYFTDENVEKEKGIIGQEIMMYEDMPESKVYVNALKNMYKNNPIRIDIAGTQESIAKIDKDVLYTCYNTFYHPSNMAMVLCGDFEPNEILNEIEKRLIKKENQGEIKRIYPYEPREIANEYKEEKMEISTPIFVIGIKDITSKEKVKKHIAIDILLKILIGNSSDLYDKLYKENLMLGDFDASYEFSNNYAHVLIQGQSRAPEELLNRLKNEVKKYKENGIKDEDFSRERKAVYSTYIKEYNSIDEISTMFLADYFKGVNSFDYLEEFDTLTKEYVEQVLKEVFEEEFFTLSVIRKEEV